MSNKIVVDFSSGTYFGDDVELWLVTLPEGYELEGEPDRQDLKTAGATFKKIRIE